MLRFLWQVELWMNWGSSESIWKATMSGNLRDTTLKRAEMWDLLRFGLRVMIFFGLIWFSLNFPNFPHASITRLCTKKDDTFNKINSWSPIKNCWAVKNVPMNIWYVLFPNGQQPLYCDFGKLHDELCIKSAHNHRSRSWLSILFL